MITKIQLFSLIFSCTIQLLNIASHSSNYVLPTFVDQTIEARKLAGPVGNLAGPNPPPDLILPKTVTPHTLYAGSTRSRVKGLVTSCIIGGAAATAVVVAAAVWFVVCKMQDFGFIRVIYKCRINSKEEEEGMEKCRIAYIEYVPFMLGIRILC